MKNLKFFLVCFVLGLFLSQLFRGGADKSSNIEATLGALSATQTELPLQQTQVSAAQTQMAPQVEFNDAVGTAIAATATAQMEQLGTEIAETVFHGGGCAVFLENNQGASYLSINGDHHVPLRYPIAASVGAERLELRDGDRVEALYKVVAGNFVGFVCSDRSVYWLPADSFFADELAEAWEYLGEITISYYSTPEPPPAQTLNSQVGFGILVPGQFDVVGEA